MTDVEQKDIVYLLDEINNTFQHDIKYALLLYQTIFDILYENNYLDDNSKDYISHIKNEIMQEIMVGKKHDMLKPLSKIKSTYTSSIRSCLSYTKNIIKEKEYYGIVSNMNLLALYLRTYEVCIDTLK